LQTLVVKYGLLEYFSLFLIPKMGQPSDFANLNSLKLLPTILVEINLMVVEKI